MLYCPICNNAVEDNASFCPHCGTQFAVDPQQINNAQNSQQYVEQYNQQQTNQPPKKRISKKAIILSAVAAVLVVVIAVVFLFPPSRSSGGSGFLPSSSTSNIGNKSAWHLGGNNIMVENVDPEDLFKDIKDTVDAKAIYSSTQFTADMLHGVYTLNEKEKDLKTVRNDIAFEDVTVNGNKFTLSAVPVAIYMGSEYIVCSDLGYQYGEYTDATDVEVAVIEFATKDSTAHTSCIYTVDGNTVTFKQVHTTSNVDEPLTYEFTGNEFKYDFELFGPFITLSKGDQSLKLKAFCFTNNNDEELYLTGYSLPDSPLIGDLDYFVSSDAFNYAVKRNGSYYDLSAYKFTDSGLFTAYLADIDLLTKEREETIKQYAYIVQSSSDFFNDFCIILLDGEKKYYYTDSVTEREARVLEEQGADIRDLTDDQIKEIAQKKEDLFKDLAREFEEQGINVTINVATGEIAMDASVLFGGDSAEITTDGKNLLNKFLTAYTAIIYNEKYDGFIAKTLVEGHTAPLAGSTYESGLSLSTQRADNVKNYCLSADNGVDVSKLSDALEAVGLSNSKPIYNSDGEIDMAACRRVSFRFMVNIEE